MSLFYVLLFCCSVFANERQAQSAVDFIPPPSKFRCAATATEGPCVGSATCRICTDCSRCAHCKSRFRSCGVCGKKSARTFPKKISPSINQPSPEKNPPKATKHWFRLTKETSLRILPDSQAEVILRFAEGDLVQVLEDSGLYWWVVVFEGRTGWVKKSLLESTRP